MLTLSQIESNWRVRAADASTGYTAACASFLVACLTLGGGTRSGFLGDVIVQFLAIPFLILVLSWEPDDHREKVDGSSRGLRWYEIGWWAAVVLVPVVQILPLSLGLTGGILAQLLPPGAAQDAIAEWDRLSVAPRETALAAMSLLPPLAMFLGVAKLDLCGRRQLTTVLILFALASCFLGLLQVAQGPNSALRFFSFTNPTEAVGFFANRNHFSALVYFTVPFLAVWTVVHLSDATSRLAKRQVEGKAVALLLLCFVGLVVLVAAQLLARSRAGLGLTIVALFGALWLSAFLRNRIGRGFVRVIGGAVVVALAFAAQFALYRLRERFGSDPLADARIVIARNTIEAAWTFMPFGSGLGTFTRIYDLFEKPGDVFGAYANRAHNDLLELWLETGVVGLSLLSAFLVWLALKAISIWRRPVRGHDMADVLITRAAVIALILLLAHCLVDYPLRTTAMATAAALACALLIPADKGGRERGASIASDKPRAGGGSRLQSAPRAAGVRTSETALPSLEWPVAGASTSHPRTPRQPWGRDTAWPDEWQRAPARTQETAASREVAKRDP